MTPALMLRSALRSGRKGAPERVGFGRPQPYPPLHRSIPSSSGRKWRYPPRWSLSDFYQFDAGKLGTVQPPPSTARAGPGGERSQGYARRRAVGFAAVPAGGGGGGATLNQLLKRGVLLFAIMEDLPIRTIGSCPALRSRSTLGCIRTR